MQDQNRQEGLFEIKADLDIFHVLIETLTREFHNLCMNIGYRAGINNHKTRRARNLHPVSNDLTSGLFHSKSEIEGPESQYPATRPVLLLPIL
ncbi:MAG: hypothetical protein A2161_14830 [Candidatus Schekmanbacteria bacterium RBG_13_48_7]|uniref:Uncharacterized protein n=1 Tax=Candidatus Schekmanbacteria bacterium RBG_13_48_7 TaxID=1817878 RepID=A0A1F7RXI8_9BACT|nr:MAG: hypothetical protein A2161_14830 [Candidatus Schekmanbacteria bacterium RBG_13_48_7]